MRGGLRFLGLAVLFGGGATLAGLYLAEGFGYLGPALSGFEQSDDVRSGVWIAAGVLYVLAGLLLAFLRRWSAVLFIVGAVLAAACMAYDMAAFDQLARRSMGVTQIRMDIASLVCALMLTALTVPLVRRRVLR